MLEVSEVRALGDVVRQQAATQPNRSAFVFEGRVTSYAELDRNANRVANGLIQLGLGRGDRIAYLGKNSDWYFELLFGAAKVGVVMTPVNWRLAAPEVAYIISDSGAKALFVGPEFTDLARRLLPDLPMVRSAVAMEGGIEDWPAFEVWRDAQGDADPQEPVAWEDVALQLYTSGTTGRPKGAMLTHGGLLGLRSGQGGPPAEWNTWSADDISLVAMPIGHIGGSGWGIMGVYNGAKGIVAREFDPVKVLDYIEHDRVTKIFMVPAAMQIVVRHPRARQIDWSCMKYLLYGASPIPLDLLKECMEVFGCGFVQMYGMTETCGTIVALPPEDHVPEGSPKMRSAGKALPGVEIAVVDEDGRPVPPGVVGEIATRSVSNMAGYWNMPEATAKTINSEGWLRTGDAGYLDGEGYLYIHDRVKDMIISGGENVYPAEVAVIGVPDPKWGEAVKAMVVLRPGATPSPEEIIAWARERVAGFKTPKSVEFIPALPRNASGKILRRELREPYWRGLERQVS
jgi:fatty-acyl-CoA synthase